MRLFVHPTGSGPCYMRMQYEAHDPYAVRATFHLDGSPATAVEWALSRDVLAEGLKHHAGHGDLQVWPGAGPEPDVLYIALGPVGESALVEAPYRDVELFLGRTQQLVPLGTEHEQFDIEAALACLLSNCAVADSTGLPEGATDRTVTAPDDH
ncbi:SsgA family sporulation/cell division regulator [Streptomyces sp. NPDC096538]|uniref:SsgA family sporulation/cell division regulator n=2 Tax=Streptomyces TaxID=1883 RepID=UPI003326739C